MNINRKLFKKYRLAILAILTLGFAVILLPGTAFAQFQGSEYCQLCHAKQFSEWSASGHPYKMMPGELAKNRPIPLPSGYVWDDISWVIGGYKWKARFIDNQGYIITTSCEETMPGDFSCTPRNGVNQYNYLTGEWSNYEAGEVQKPYDCGKCHTTNWVENPDPTNLDGNQGGLPGMWGTFDVGGIHCEQCHGNNGGDGHMTGTSRIDKSADACGACHYRTSPPGTENSIPASGGWIKHHEQYNEMKASPHMNMDCVTCHNPHKRGEYSIKEGKDCGTCHPVQAASYAEDSMYDYNVTCIDCHMAFATKSAQPLGPYQGDVWTHLFSINTDPDANLFTEAGDFVALDGEGQAAVTLDFACKRCHETTEMDELARFAKNFHGTERDDQEQLLPELHYAGITPGSSGHYWAGTTRDGEGFLIDISYRPNGRILIVVSFYTFDPMGGQTWLVGAKTIDPGVNVATIDLAIPEGAMWGPDFDPADLPTPRQAWGTLELMTETCGTATAIATPNAESQALGYVEYSWDLSRDLSIPGHSCPSMMNNPAILTQ